MSKAFYNNLKENIRKGSPDKVFLWPEVLTAITSDKNIRHIKRNMIPIF